MDKVGAVMGEYKRGKLHSGSSAGPVVKGRKQALAIALSEAGKTKAKTKAKKRPLGGERDARAARVRAFEAMHGDDAL